MSNLTLYPEEYVGYDHNGLGILGEVTDSLVTEEINKSFELEFAYPVTGRRYADLLPGRVVTAKPDPLRQAQPFRICRINKPMNGLVRVQAQHIAYDLKYITCHPFAAQGPAQALTAMPEEAVIDCPFTFSTELAGDQAFALEKPGDIWTALGTKKGGALSVFGGELEFDRFSVALKARRGQDRHVSIRYGKNLTDFEQEEKIAEMVYGIHPYWQKSGVTVEVFGGAVFPESLQSFPSGSYKLSRVKAVDFADTFETAPTEEQLRAAAMAYIDENGIGKPEVSWTIGFVPLEQTLEYRGKAVLERVCIGDTVHVYFPMYNAQVDARAVVTRYKPHLDRYESITLGSARRSIARTIAQIRREL